VDVDGADGKPLLRGQFKEGAKTKTWFGIL
jgi:hypothetical protein